MAQCTGSIAQTALQTNTNEARPALTPYELSADDVSLSHSQQHYAMHTKMTPTKGCPSTISQPYDTPLTTNQCRKWPICAQSVIPPPRQALRPTQLACKNHTSQQVHEAALVSLTSSRGMFLLPPPASASVASPSCMPAAAATAASCLSVSSASAALPLLMSI